MFVEEKEQLEKRNILVELFEKRCLKLFNPNGDWISDFHEPSIARDRLFFASAYFMIGTEEAVKKANKIILSTNFVQCNFSPMIVSQILHKYSGFLESETKNVLTKYLLDSINNVIDSSLDFVGVNDNFPVMNTYAALIGGKYLKMKEAENKGKARLKQLAALLTRRGSVSEYNSPTYTPIQIMGLAEIVNSVEDDEIKEIALKCEKQIWLDFLLHFHLPTSTIAGPYSRAYTGDSIGVQNSTRMFLYPVLGGVMKPDVFRTLFDKSMYSPNGHAMGLWNVNTIFHCPKEYIEELRTRQYPFYVKTTAESSSSKESGEALNPVLTRYYQDNCYEYPATNGICTTYMTEDYALGVSEKEFHCGVQTDSFHILYKRKTNVSEIEDIGTVYARYLINDKIPGQMNYYPQFNIHRNPALLWDEGRKIGLQHNSSAMMLYKPKTDNLDNVSSLKLGIILPKSLANIKEIRIGNKKVTEAGAASSANETIWVHDGDVYMAFHPLNATMHGGEWSVRVETNSEKGLLSGDHTVSDYVMISLYNYSGAERSFTREELLLTANGFVVEVGSKKEYGSFDKFINSMSEFKIEDLIHTNLHSRWTKRRKTTYTRDGIELSCEYNPVSEGVQYATINGKIQIVESLQVNGQTRSFFAE